MDLQLQGKVVLITGAGGIGSAIANAAVQEKAVAIIAEKRADRAHALENELQSHGATALVKLTDISDPANCQQLVQDTIERFERIDALINNAGVNDRIGLEHGSPAEYVGSLERNLFHYYYMAHYAFPSLKRSRGSILNIASKIAMTGQGGTSGYASAKGAILALTREWAAELSNYGIRVNAVVPAEVMTPMYREWLNTFLNPEAKLSAVVSKIPLGKRMTTPEEIAAAVMFLISAKASHITGQHIFVDGGYVHLDRALT